jgi:phosphoserine phosphatase/dolichol kinase
MDVDGVLFKGHFFLHLARSIGISTYIRAFLLCFLFNMNRISIRELLTRIYRFFKGVPFDHAQRVYKNIPTIRLAGETIQTLRKHGYLVVLISSGVPDPFVKDLAIRLSADYGHGIETEIRDNLLSGNISGQLAKQDGKRILIEKILLEYNLTWKDTVIVVDDRNNLDIMHKTSLNIGVNAHYAVRQKAQYLVDSGNLSEILDIMDIEDAGSYRTLFAGMRKQFRYSWYQEIRRKSLHILIALVPVFSTVIYHTTLAVLLFLLVVYSVSECLRINGFSFPFLGTVTKSSIRKGEDRRFAFGPVTLVLGAGLSLACFPAHIANIVIWIVAFADTAAAMVGKSIGNHRIPYNIKKSIEGSLAAWITAFFCGYVYLPVVPAILAASLSCIIESLPLRSLDNVCMPLGTGILLLCIGYS